MGKRSIGRVAAVLAVLVAMMIALPGAAYAKTVKAKYVSFPCSPSTFYSIPRINRGTTTVKISKRGGLVKFTAPATKKYKFTFSALKAKKKPVGAVVALEKLYDHTLKGVKTRTKEGKRTFAIFYDASFAKQRKGEYFTSTDNAKYTYLSKRVSSITLRKGEVVYLSGAITGPSALQTGTFKVKIW